MARLMFAAILLAVLAVGPHSVSAACNSLQNAALTQRCFSDLAASGFRFADGTPMTNPTGTCLVIVEDVCKIVTYDFESDNTIKVEWNVGIDDRVTFVVSIVGASATATANAGAFTTLPGWGTFTATAANTNTLATPGTTSSTSSSTSTSQTGPGVTPTPPPPPPPSCPSKYYSSSNCNNSCSRGKTCRPCTKNGGTKYYCA